MSKSISEDFKDAKINMMIEDLLTLEKETENFKEALLGAISEVPEALENAVSDKLIELLQVGEELEKNITEANKEIFDLKETAKHEITKHFSLILADLKSELKSVTDTYKSEAKKTKPLSTTKIVGLCLASVLLLTSVFSGAVYYALSVKNKSELEKFGSGIVELSELTENIIQQLPKEKKLEAESRYKKIMSTDR
ncbi:hypothetical protein [Erwinia tasmaniensis]|uniref:Uncharacterized protein n=1 Tax=Erwinia tasmaniensis (strain DSM 17950 / CFBP 7177 / CIP 109463 / NCPPB 4357 / Et1/99) TaxID=465817 RepID=B2VAX8_ERWT9|nr:hypothetical protein [Erwinia tasmaniensis]CAO94897.1 Conserved hypothetical protein, similar to plasmid encoded protein YcgC [Erwinia tasmaniensis Et1/99]